MLIAKEKTPKTQKTGNGEMNPYRAALILMHNWVTMGTGNPKRMCIDDMNFWLSGMEYNVTEKRREAILDHVEKMMEPIQQGLEDKLIKAGFSL